MEKKKKVIRNKKFAEAISFVCGLHYDISWDGEYKLYVFEVDEEQQQAMEDIIRLQKKYRKFMYIDGKLVSVKGE